MGYNDFEDEELLEDPPLRDDEGPLLAVALGVLGLVALLVFGGCLLGAMFSLLP